MTDDAITLDAISTFVQQGQAAQTAIDELIDPELALLGRIIIEFPKLDAKARHRMLKWMTSWLVDTARKANPERGAHVEAFKLVAAVFESLRDAEWHAVVESFVALMPWKPPPRVFATPPRTWSFQRKRKRNHCSKCGADGHDKRARHCSKCGKHGHDARKHS